jgi:hypothetical protein
LGHSSLNRSAVGSGRIFRCGRAPQANFGDRFLTQIGLAIIDRPHSRMTELLAATKYHRARR